MNKNIQKLINDLGFSKTESEEIMQILNIKNFNTKDIVSDWEDYGAKWTDEEVLEYINEGSETKLSLSEILDGIVFHKLSTGLIVSWGY